MQIILLEKVVNLGQLGEIVKVKPGYARNFLIPTGKARRATPENIAEFETRRAELERNQADVLARAQAVAAQLEGIVVSVAQKAGVDGRLFGSVTNMDIAEALKALGHDISKAAVRMPNGPLKQVGEHDVVLDLHADAKSNIKVTVVAEA